MSTLTPIARVRAAYRTLAATDRPEAWITLREQADLLAEAAALEDKLAAGADLPLAGACSRSRTTSTWPACRPPPPARAYAYQPAADATAVARLLRGRRDRASARPTSTSSPPAWSAPAALRRLRNACDPAHVSGGSSSGSAVAVAAGDRRPSRSAPTPPARAGYPPRFNDIVGLKPTLGLVSATGVVPACRTLDCVSVFAPTGRRRRRGAGVMTGPDAADPLASRAWPADTRFAAMPHARRRSRPPRPARR